VRSQQMNERLTCVITTRNVGPTVLLISTVEFGREQRLISLLRLTSLTPTL
jgi:hypothetical protein